MTQSDIAQVQEADQASLRLNVFDTRRGWQLGILMPAFVLTMFATWIFSGLSSIIQADATSFNNDFRIFWGAARLAIVDTPIAAFDVDKLAAMHGISDGRWMPWAYPPSFLVALMPLAMVSFPLAWGLFSLLSMLAIAAATRPFTRGHPQVWLAFAFAPAYLPPLFMGQNSLLWAAGLLAALMLVVFQFDPSFRYSFAPIVLLAFATCLWAVIRRLRAAAATPGNLEEHP